MSLQNNSRVAYLFYSSCYFFISRMKLKHSTNLKTKPFLFLELKKFVCVHFKHKLMLFLDR